MLIPEIAAEYEQLKNHRITITVDVEIESAFPLMLYKNNFTHALEKTF